MSVFPNGFEKLPREGQWSAGVLAPARHAGGKEYNRFNETLSLPLFLMICEGSDPGLLLLAAFTAWGVRVRGFREVAIAVIELQVLLAQRRIDQLDFDAAI